MSTDAPEMNDEALHIPTVVRDAAEGLARIAGTIFLLDLIVWFGFVLPGPGLRSRDRMGTSSPLTVPAAEPTAAEAVKNPA